MVSHSDTVDLHVIGRTRTDDRPIRKHYRLAVVSTPDAGLRISFLRVVDGRPENIWTDEIGRFDLELERLVV